MQRAAIRIQARLQHFPRQLGFTRVECQLIPEPGPQDP